MFNSGRPRPLPKTNNNVEAYLGIQVARLTCQLHGANLKTLAESFRKNDMHNAGIRPLASFLERIIGHSIVLPNDLHLNTWKAGRYSERLGELLIRHLPFNYSPPKVLHGGCQCKRLMKNRHCSWCAFVEASLSLTNVHSRLGDR